MLLFDENNKEARRELLIIKQKADKAKKASKKAFGGMFDKDSSSLYEDKEEEKKKKALEKIEEEIRQMKKKAETLKKRKAEWETECVSRMARSEPAISYDNWDAEQLAKDDKEKEERKKKKEEEKKAKVSERSVREQSLGTKRCAWGNVTSFFGVFFCFQLGISADGLRWACFGPSLKNSFVAQKDAPSRISHHVQIGVSKSIVRWSCGRFSDSPFFGLF